MKKNRKEDMIFLLRQRGLKITPQRLAIVDAIVEHCNSHPGASLIFSSASKKAKSVSLSTVYATLKEFAESGLIRQMEFDRMENRYDLDLADHINLVCKRCGKIVDYHILAPIEPKDIARKTGFIVTDTRIEFYGYCRNCLKRQG